MAAGSCKKCLMSGPRFGEGPRSRPMEGCPAAWTFFRCCFWVKEGDLSRWASWTTCRGMALAAFLWQGPMVPLAMPLGPSSCPVLALEKVAGVQPHSGSWLAEPFYTEAGPPMGLPSLGKLSFTQSVLPFSLGGSVLMAGWMSAGGLQFSASSRPLTSSLP